MPDRSLNLSSERGAVQFYMVCAAAALAGLLLMVVNTGTHTMKKVELQNTTDAAVYSGATWISRGLNVISMNNVIQANLLAIAFAVPAFDRALTVSLLILRAEIIACHAAAALTFGALEVVCIGLEYAHQAITVFQNTVVKYAVELTKPTDSVIWRVMRGIGKESVIVKNTVPWLAEAEVFRIATADSKARGALIVARSESGGLTLLPTMPAKVGTFQDLCDATRRALYPSSRSPIDTVQSALMDNPVAWALNLLTGFRGIFRAFLNAQYAQYCGGPPSSTAIPEPVSSMSECRARNGEARWGASVYHGPLRPTFVEATQDLDSEGPIGEAVSYRSFTQPCTWRPPGEMVGSSGTIYRSGYVQTVGSADAPAYRVVLTLYRAELMTVPSKATADPVPEAVAGNDWRPTPVVLIDNGTDRSTRGARARLEYMAIAMSYPTTRVGGTPWESPLGANTFGYGQAKSFNPTTFDLFTQNWRAKLVPASALENGMLGGSLDGANATRDASPLSFLSGLHLNEYIRWLNNH